MVILPFVYWNNKLLSSCPGESGSHLGRVVVGLVDRVLAGVGVGGEVVVPAVLVLGGVEDGAPALHGQLVPQFRSSVPALNHRLHLQGTPSQYSPSPPHDSPRWSGRHSRGRPSPSRRWR